MTGPLDETRPLLRADSGIRVLSLDVDETGKWRVEADVDDDREEHEDPSAVRFAMIDSEREAFQLTVPVEVLKELGERIEEL